MSAAHAPALGWIRSEVTTLTHFSVLTGIVVGFHGGDFLPFVVCYMAGIILVVAFTAVYFYRLHAKSSVRLAKIDMTLYFARDSFKQLEECERKLQESVRREQAHVRVLTVIRESIQCPIMQEVPVDPVVLITGYVCSDKAMRQDAWHNNGYYRCPINRVPLYPGDIKRCYALNQICDEIRWWEENVCLKK